MQSQIQLAINLIQMWPRFSIIIFNTFHLNRNYYKNILITICKAHCYWLNLIDCHYDISLQFVVELHERKQTWQFITYITWCTCSIQQGMGEFESIIWKPHVSINFNIHELPIQCDQLPAGLIAQLIEQVHWYQRRHGFKSRSRLNVFFRL